MTVGVKLLSLVTIHSRNSSSNEAFGMAHLTSDDCHPPSKIWSLSSPKIVTHFPHDGHQPSPGGSNTIPTHDHQLSKCLVAHHPEDIHPPTVEWSTTIPRMGLSFPRMIITIYINPKIEGNGKKENKLNGEEDFKKKTCLKMKTTSKIRNKLKNEEDLENKV